MMFVLQLYWFLCICVVVLLLMLVRLFYVFRKKMNAFNEVAEIYMRRWKIEEMIEVFK